MISADVLIDFIEAIESTTKDKSTAKKIRAFMEEHKLWDPIDMKAFQEPKSTRSNPNSQIVYNAVECLQCHELLVSYYGHDYKTCSCPNQAMVDGGNEYARYGAVDMDKIKNIIYTVDDDFEIVRDHAHWGTRGRDGMQPLSYISPSKMTDGHLSNLLDYGIVQWFKDIVIKEIAYRKQHNIRLLDKEIRPYTKGEYFTKK
jgi:hypothetical protein